MKNGTFNISYPILILNLLQAYRTFGARVKTLKKKLDEKMCSLSSPIPSPDINAPSPSPDSDIDLPTIDNLSELLC